ncbi:MAG TPA: hypothetical protein VL549_12590 [Gemmatimonadales bacterium]|nr:hypothetical protein [Gemmatimonadales bacterium]
MRIGITVVTLAVVACGSHAKPSTTPTPVNQPPVGPPAVQPPVNRGNDGNIRLGPSALRYVMHSVVHIDQEFQGMHQPLDFGLRAFFAVTITGPADSVGYPTTITIDSIAADSGTTVPMGINLGNAKGLSFVGRLTPKGDFRNQSASDSTAAQSLAPVVGSFKNFFPRLPPSGVTLGANWTDTTSENDRAAGAVTVKSVNRSHAAAWDDRSGVRTLRVDVTSDFTIQGSGQQMGQPFDVAGTGVRSGTDFISTDGRYMGGESRDSTNMTITLTVQQMTIPRTQVSRTTVAVLP